MKNLKLKAKIVELFGSQAVFAKKVKTSAPIVSMVINGFHSLDENQRRTWAKRLRCQVSDIFPTSENNQ